MAVELRVGNRGEDVVFELIAKRADMPVIVGNAFTGIFGCFTQTGDERHAFGATAPTALLVTTMQVRRKRCLSLHI